MPKDRVKTALDKYRPFLEDPEAVWKFVNKPAIIPLDWKEPEFAKKHDLQDPYPTADSKRQKTVAVVEEDEPKERSPLSTFAAKLATTSEEVDAVIHDALASEESLAAEVDSLKEDIGKNKRIGLMWPRGHSLEHAAAKLLEEYSIHGCPVDCGDNWSRMQIEAALLRGSHPSAKVKEAIIEMRKEAADKEAGGYAKVVRYGDIKDDIPPQLKISPVAAIPHKSRLFWFILDLSFELIINGKKFPSVNQSTRKQAKQESMDQLGEVIKRILHTMAQARKEDPKEVFHFAKLDIKDGFWRLAVSDQAAWNFCYVLPSLDKTKSIDDIEIVVPNALQMGWCESPPFFCSASETGRDTIEKLLREDSLDPHVFEDLMFTDNFIFGDRKSECIRLMEVYVNDYIAMTNDSSKDNLLHFSRSMLHGIHSVFPPPEVTGHNGEDPIAQKKLRAGEGHWASTKEVLGWMIDGEFYTITLPTEKLEKLVHDIRNMERRKAIPFKQFQKMAGRLQHAALGLVGGTTLMSPIWQAMQGEPDYINVKEATRIALRDWRWMIKNLLKNPTDISLLVIDDPDYIGYLDACKLGAGGVLLPGKQDFPPVVWQVEWPQDIRNKLDSNELTINDLELAAIVLEYFAFESLLPQLYNIRLGLFCDNTSAVSWGQKAMSSKSIVAGKLLKMLFLRIRENQVGRPLITNIEGTKNGMADVASRAFPGGEFQEAHQHLQSYFDSHFPLQHASWDVYHLPKELTSHVIACLHGEQWEMESLRKTRKTGKNIGNTGRNIVDKLKSIQCSEKQAKDSLYWQSPHLLQGSGQDPPAVAQLAVPVEVAHTAVEAGLLSSETKEQTIGDLICIAFYYLLRVGEYTKPRTVTRNGKKVRATRTVQFTAGNIGFWDKDGNAILHNAPLEKLLTAHSATLKITNQKNGKMGQTIHHFCTGKSTSPIKALTRRVHHIYNNGGTADTLFCDYWDDNNEEFVSIKSTDIRTVVRSTVAYLKLDTKGIDPSLVGTHSLRSGGAMTLKLSGHDDTTIMKYGRWSSLTFTMYIHTQIAHIAKDVAFAMSNPIPFLNIAAIKTT